MLFSEFVQHIPKIKDLELPGEEAHFKMAPELRNRLLKDLRLKEVNPRQAGVLALFYPDADALATLVFILRKTYRGVHSGQVGFPGGKHEREDRDLADTALRETEEEIGVPRQQVELLSPLSEVYIPPSNFVVRPFVGVTYETPAFKLQEEEVEDVLEVTVKDVLDDSNVITQTLTTSYARAIEVPAFQLNQQVVWGATAMMLSELKELLRQVL